MDVPAPNLIESYVGMNVTVGAVPAAFVFGGNKKMIPDKMPTIRTAPAAKIFAIRFMFMARYFVTYVMIAFDPLFCGPMEITASICALPCVAPMIS